MDSRKGHATQGVTYRYGWGSGGERGIRTPDTLPGTPDFESGAFSRSASSPEFCDLAQLWRRGWDSNPRYVAVYTLSKRAPSAARPPLPESSICAWPGKNPSG